MYLNKYEFDSGDILRIPYFIKKDIYLTKSNQINSDNSKHNLELKNFVLNIKKKTLLTRGIPSFEQIYEKFFFFFCKIQTLKESIGNKIDWYMDLSHVEYFGSIKCRVDGINKVNVIYQNSFDFNYSKEAIGNC